MICMFVIVFVIDGHRESCLGGRFHLKRREVIHAACAGERTDDGLGAHAPAFSRRKFSGCGAGARNFLAARLSAT